MLVKIFLMAFYCGVALSSMDINDFFPDIHGNLTKITWAHAVNSQEYLKSALNSSVMMLEADVIYGKLNGTGDSIPVMGHPPATISDLSLQDFLTTTYTFNQQASDDRKGVKLDFKSTDVFLKSIDLITQLYSTIDYPVWINADIISGPLNSLTIPVNPGKFLNGSRIFVNSVLSLGWTTTAPSEGNYYTDEHIDKMVKAIRDNDVQQDVTFAVRAGITAQSRDQMRTLKDQVNNCTITIWSSQGDNVDVPKLREVIADYGVERVFIDVPQDLYDRLDLGNL